MENQISSDDMPSPVVKKINVKIPKLWRKNKVIKHEIAKREQESSDESKYAGAHNMNYGMWPPIS